MKKKIKKKNNEKKREDIRRARTQKLKNFMNLNKIGKNMMKVNSFGLGFDVISIKEEKDEDNLSICNFDIQLNNQSHIDSNANNNKIVDNNFCSTSNFLENSSIAPDMKTKEFNKMLIINHVDDFGLNRKYLYPKNVKLNVKKVNVKRIIHVNKEKKENISNNIDVNKNVNIDNNEKCNIF